VEGVVSDLEAFLMAYPRMSVCPFQEQALLLEGTYAFLAQWKSCPAIADDFELRIEVPRSWTVELPKVYESAGKIPRDGKHHVNGDGSLCLGAPLRLRMKVAGASSLVRFAEECLTPYLYAISHKLRYGSFPFGELLHGVPGVLNDYCSLFGLKSQEQARAALALLGLDRRDANKRPCPCGCGKRYGKCSYRSRLEDFRKYAKRSWFKQHAENPGGGK